MFRNYHQILDLQETLIQLRAGGAVEPSTRRGVADAGLWTVAVIRADSGRALHADVWERHPAGDEVLGALSGAVEVYLRDDGDASRPVATLTAGQWFIVPTGTWHRLDVTEPAELVAITPRTGTQHERRTES